MCEEETSLGRNDLLVLEKLFQSPILTSAEVDNNENLVNYVSFEVGRN